MKENKLLGQQLFYGQYLDDLYLALTEMKATNRYGKSIGQEQALIYEGPIIQFILSETGQARPWHPIWLLILTKHAGVGLRYLTMLL
jgi:hypothetical protein